MVTTPTQVEQPESKERAEQALRMAIAGHPAGAVRRILLYFVAMLAIIGGASMPDAASVCALVAGSAVILLAMTDVLA